MKRILDACCGSRMFWFNKENPDVEFVDIREMDREAIWTSGNGQTTRFCSIRPTTVADFRNLPFPDNTFCHVVFDPPHMLTLGENSWMAKKYGRLSPDTWKEDIGKGFAECMRVLKPNGTLIFKWNETDIPVKDILALIDTKPLYGHRSGKLSKTHWIAFVKDGETE